MISLQSRKKIENKMLFTSTKLYYTDRKDIYLQKTQKTERVRQTYPCTL